MINKTSKEFNDKNFQKWIAHHPWHLISVNGSKPIVHKNVYWIHLVTAVTSIVLLVSEISDFTKWVNYQTEKTTSTEKQLQKKYTKQQIARYEWYSKMQGKINQK